MTKKRTAGKTEVKTEVNSDVNSDANNEVTSDVNNETNNGVDQDPVQDNPEEVVLESGMLATESDDTVATKAAKKSVKKPRKKPRKKAKKKVAKPSAKLDTVQVTALDDVDSLPPETSEIESTVVDPNSIFAAPASKTDNAQESAQEAVITTDDSHVQVREKVRGVREERWKALLEAHNGNISRAAAELGVSSPRGMFLTRDFKLNIYAAELRVKSGGRKIGRPPM